MFVNDNLLHFCHLLTYVDNPNYFDIDSIPSPSIENRSSGLFTFRKRTSSSNKQPQSPATIGVYNNIDNTNLGKRRGSIKNLWRSRSNSASINYPKVIIINITLFPLLLRKKFIFNVIRIIKFRIKRAGMQLHLQHPQMHQ